MLVRKPRTAEEAKKQKCSECNFVECSDCFKVEPDWHWNRVGNERMSNETEECRWCLRLVPKQELKTVRIIKWKDELTHGIRRICRDCRKSLKGEIEIIREE